MCVCSVIRLAWRNVASLWQRAKINLTTGDLLAYTIWRPVNKNSTDFYSHILWAVLFVK